MDESVSSTVLTASRRSVLVAWLPALMLIAASFQILSTLYGGYWFKSQDSYWWPFRIIEYSQGWKANLLYPRWCPDLYGGYGYPLFNWYCPGLCATAVALMLLLGVGPIAALKLTLAAFIVGGALGFYGLVYGETSRSDAALLSAFVYLFLPYHFTDIFLRGELGEFAAYSIVPFVLWGYRALGRIEKARMPLIGTLTAVANGAVWFYHSIIALCLTPIIAMILFCQVLRARGRPSETLRHSAFGLCVALSAILIASVYLAPAWFEQSLVRLDNLRQFCQPTAKYLVSWSSLFQSGFFAIGLPAIVGAAVLAAACALPMTRRKLTGAIVWWSPAVLYVPLMADSRFSAWFWRVSPLGNYILFPWRLLGFVGLFAAIGIGLTWASLIPLDWRRLRWAGVALLCLLIAVSSNSYNRAEFISSPTPDQLRPAAIRAAGMITTVVADEYLPRTVAISPEFLRSVPIVSTDGLLLTEQPNAAAVIAHAKQITPFRYAITAQVSEPTALDLRVFDFPGWKLQTLAGPATAEQSTSPFGVLRLFFPLAGSYRLTAYFASTPLRTASGLTSCLALLLTYPFLAYLNRRNIS